MISSASAKVAPALRSSYAGSKAAISALYDSLRTEVNNYFKILDRSQKMEYISRLFILAMFKRIFRRIR